MKKNYSCILLLFALIFCFQTAKAQLPNIKNYSTYDSCIIIGPTYYANTFYVTIDTKGLTSGLTLQTFFGDGSDSISTVNISGVTGNYHKYAATGTYTIKHVLKQNSVSIDSVQFNLNIVCHNIYFTFYHDINNNCLYDAGDDDLPGSVSIKVDSNGTNVATITGQYHTYYKPLGQGVYTFTLMTLPVGAVASCPISGIQTVNVTSAFTNTYLEYGIQCGTTTSYDLSSNFVYNNFIPAANLPHVAGYIYFHASNFSCNNIPATITLQKTSKYNYVGAKPIPSSISGNTITWNYSSIPASGINFQVWLSHTGSLSLGDTVKNIISISPTINDVNVTNNSETRIDTIKASYDPNVKSVSPSGLIIPGTTLTYTIHFENIGNDTAYNVHILDTLSNYLDIQSFRIISSSHKVSTNLYNQGPNIMKFDFPNIKLADSSDKEFNKGYVVFSLRTKTNLAPLTVIPNRAGIYFDINPVVMTNQVENIIEPVGIKQTLLPLATVHPNPVHDVLTIRMDKHQYSNAKLLNTIGQTIKEQPLTNNVSQIDVKALPNGIYYLVLTGESGVKTEKIEKQ